MNINNHRLWQHIQELGNIGKNEDGSVTRFPFTEADEAAAALIRKWMREAGLDVHTDACGNVIGIRKGSDEKLSPIVCGSHFDTVKQGGIFDGCLGILAGIEALQTIDEAGIRLKRTIMIVGFRDEEGNRFGYGMIGSRSFCGNVDAIGLESKDENGMTLSEAMHQVGYHPEQYHTCKVTSIHAYVELHIEQADVLYRNGYSLGIVEGIAGLQRDTIVITGKSGHAGATPMHSRRDPILAMAEWITHISKQAMIHSHTTATIGRIQVEPGVCNVIAERATFSLDLRSLDESVIQAISDHMKQVEKTLEDRYHVRIQRSLDQKLPAVLCDETWKRKLEQCCEHLHIKTMRLPSGAGHDCMNFKQICPTAMIFIRSQNDGASHCKEEFSTMEDCENGCNLLLELLCRNSL